MTMPTLFRVTALVFMCLTAVSAARAGSEAFIQPAGAVSTSSVHTQTVPTVTKKGVKGKPRQNGFVLQAAAKKAAAKKAKKADEVETFKKSDFVTSVSQMTGMTKADSEAAIQAVVDTITEQLTLEKKIFMAGFGTFQVKQRAARKGRNPQTGEEIDIAASKAPTFSAAKGLKDKVNGRA